jgi:hypothetical protein
MYSFILAFIVILLLVVALSVVGGGASKKRKNAIYEQLKKCRSLAKGDASARKDCLIRMDSLVSKSLSYAGVKGSTMGEKLKNARKLFDRDIYEELWKWHKLRNRAVHENEEISGSEIKSAVKYFTIAIKRLLR